MQTGKVLVVADGLCGCCYADHANQGAQLPMAMPATGRGTGVTNIVKVKPGILDQVWDSCLCCRPPGFCFLANFMLQRVLFFITLLQVVVPASILWCFRNLLLNIPFLNLNPRTFKRDTARDLFFIFMTSLLVLIINLHYESTASDHLVTAAGVILTAAAELLYGVFEHYERQKGLAALNHRKYTIPLGTFVFLFLLPLLLQIYVVILISMASSNCSELEKFHLPSGVRQVACATSESQYDRDILSIGTAACVIAARLLSFIYLQKINPHMP